MEHVIQLHIEKLPEGVYLATSDEVQGLAGAGTHDPGDHRDRPRRSQEVDRSARRLGRARLGAGQRSVRLPFDRRHLMGRLAGFSYREVVKRLKQSGLEFHRQAAGSHEIWLKSCAQPLHNDSQSSGRHAGRNAARHPKQAGIDAETFLEGLNHRPAAEAVPCAASGAVVPCVSPLMSTLSAPCMTTNMAIAAKATKPAMTFHMRISFPSKPT